MRGVIPGFKAKPYQTQKRQHCSVTKHTWSVWPVTGSCGGAHGLGLLRVGREQEGSWGRTSTEPRGAPYFLGSPAALVLSLVGEISSWWERSGQQELPALIRMELEATGKGCSRCLKEEEYMSEWVTKDVVWELAVVFTTQFHSAGLNSLQHSIDDDAWRYKDCILISKSRASLPLVMNTFSELQVKEIL